MEIIATFESGGIWIRCELECPRQHQNMLEGAQVVIKIMHQLRNLTHQFRINGLLGLNVIIHRFVNPLAHDALPHAVSHHSGKLLARSCDDPVRELHTPVSLCLFVRHADCFPEGCFRSQIFTRIGIAILVIRGKLDHAFATATERHAVNPIPEKLGDAVILTAVFLIGLILPPETAHVLLILLILTLGEGSEVVEILALGFSKRIIMALRALHAGAEENAHGIREVVERHPAVDRVVANRRRFGIPAISRTRDEGSYEIIPWHIVIHRLADPVAVRLVRRLAALPTVSQAKQVERPVGHVARVALGFHQISHQFLALCRVFDFDKSQGLLRRRDAPNGNQKSPPHKGGIVRYFWDR